MLVKELQAEPYNPILLYKPQGITDPKLPGISKDGFILALQTEFQRDLYRQYASTVTCIDSTHKTNAYDFKLVTLLVHVVDEYREGIAIHYISGCFYLFMHQYAWGEGGGILQPQYNSTTVCVFAHR